MLTVEEQKREKAKNLRYKKPISKQMNLEHIKDTLYEIQEECEEVRWYTDSDDDSLIDALDGDEDQAYEFRMMFADLCAEVERMLDDISGYWADESFKIVFDTFFAAIDKGGELLGWDSYEQDYFGLDCLSTSYASEEAEKKMMKLTKENLIYYSSLSFKIAMNYISLQNRYDNLKASLDILKSKNNGYIQTIKKIEELYNQIRFTIWGAENFDEFDRFTSCLPQEAWIQ